MGRATLTEEGWTVPPITGGGGGGGAGASAEDIANEIALKTLTVAGSFSATPQATTGGQTESRTITAGGTSQMVYGLNANRIDNGVVINNDSDYSMRVAVGGTPSEFGGTKLEPGGVWRSTAIYAVHIWCGTTGARFSCSETVRA